MPPNRLTPHAVAANAVFVNDGRTRTPLTPLPPAPAAEAGAGAGLRVAAPQVHHANVAGAAAAFVAAVLPQDLLGEERHRPPVVIRHRPPAPAAALFGGDIWGARGAVLTAVRSAALGSSMRRPKGGTTTSAEHCGSPSGVSKFVNGPRSRKTRPWLCDVCCCYSIYTLYFAL